MLFRIARFEIAYQLRQPLFWLVTGLFIVMTFVATSTNGLQIIGALGNVHRNAPWVVVGMLGQMSLIGTFITTVFVAGAILRDFQRNTHELFFARPVRKVDYFLGRFIGAYLIACAVFSGTAIGMFVGSLMPWVDPEQLGPVTLVPYFFGLLVMAFPNLLFCGAVFFALASLSRKVFVTYLGLIGFLAFYFLSRLLVGDLDNQATAALLDPFGRAAFQQATQYWTLVERNAQLPELTGLLLTNRLLWLTLSLVCLGGSLALFRPIAILSSQRRRRWKQSASSALNRTAPVDTTTTPGTTTGTSTEAPLRLNKIQPVFTNSTALRQFLHQARLEVLGVFRSIPFLLILALGMFNLIGGARSVGQIVGTPAYPVTHLMLYAIQGAYVFLLVFIITIYSGELIWRERSVKLSEIVDAMPTPNWVFLAAKLVAQMFVVVVFLAVGIIATMVVQMSRGYFHFELPVYAQGFVVTVIPFLLACVLASFFQVSAGRKIIGFLLMILYLISKGLMPYLGFEHNLYRFGNTPRASYSDMNGYGHFVQPVAWFSLYWTLAAAILVVLSVLLWVRGTDTSFRTRLRIARQRFRGPIRGVLAGLMLAFVAVGGWIFYNTNVLNEYTTKGQREAWQATYEKELRQYKDVALPRISGVEVDVDIFPEERRVEARGSYHLINRNAEPLQEIHLSIPRQAKINSLDLPPHTESARFDDFGYTIYRLDEPLAPGAETELRFDLTVENLGFVNSGSNTSVVHNGTFFNNKQYFPSFGYNERVQLVNRNTRRKYGLPLAHRMAKVDDLFARRNAYIASDADWIHFETTVSTHPDQIAIAPGYLQREWTEDGRRYFHYKMDAPILNFYAFLSADYQVQRDQLGDIAIEVFYHQGHDYNVDRMIDSVKKSIHYFEANFSPYQHRQMRIIEFPNYVKFAQSFPNTVPFSEGVGFIADFDESDDTALDYPFYVTAHEVAHQWWAHQVIGGNVQGRTMLSETFAQHSALMIMEQEYGPEKMRRFLKYELDRYLRNRGGELIEEMPLMLVEDQNYIHYNKGSLIMYALRDAIGEDNLNRALARFVEAVKFQQPPYTNTLEFMEFLRLEMPQDMAEVDGPALLADLFETITLFENRVEDASYAERPDGTFAVTLNAKARKVRADGEGTETDVALNDWIDIGVFGEAVVDGKRQETVLLLEKRHITQPDVTFELIVDAKPVRAGIDPYNKLIDRNSNDNVKKVSASNVAALAGDTAVH